MAKYDAIISLGSDCLFKQYMTEMGYRKNKKNGEKTMPFDLAIHSYESVFNYLTKDFEEYTNPSNFEMNEENLIINKEIPIAFIHESEQFSKIIFDNKWIKTDKSDNFASNNFEKLIERYDQRIKNIRELMTNKNILFTYHTTTNEHCADLFDFLLTQNFHFDFLILNTNETPEFKERMHKNYFYFNCPIPNNEKWNSSHENSKRIKRKIF